MPFSEEWEKENYSQGKQINKYPFTDLISLVSGYFKQYDKSYTPSVLELGCGTGPNIQFFLDNKFEYNGIEGANSAVKIIKERFGNRANIKNCDFTLNIPFENDYCDLVVDRSAITHNTKSEIVKVVGECHRVLKNNGLMIIIDWFSTRHSMTAHGDEVENNTKNNYRNGQFKGVGIVHYFDEQEIREMFSGGWEIIYLLHKTKNQIIPDSKNGVSATYNIVVKKKIEKA